MLTKDHAAEIFARLRHYSSADEVEALFFGGRSALTRFANNTIHQNVAEEHYGVSVRTVFGGRTARASSNKLDNQNLRRVVHASEALAKVQHPDADLLPMPSPVEALGSGDGTARASLSVEEFPQRYYPQTAETTAEERAQAIEEVVGVASTNKLTAAGIFATAQSIEGIFNTSGLAVWHEQTSSEISVTMLASDSSGWRKANSPDIRNLDPLFLAETAAGKAMESARPREIPAGKYTVILEPAAVLDLVGFMFSDFAGLAILDQRSFLNNRVGEKIFGDNINIWDDVAHSLQSGSPFDGEGVRRRRVQLVDHGVVKRLVYARSTARKMKNSEYGDRVGLIEPTGHGYPLPNDIGEAPMNIVFAEPREPRSIDQMIASTERGILLTRLWYIREVDPYEKILTGMTRDGSFYVENGKVTYGVRNFRFNESLLHMLSNVVEMGKPVRASGEESFDMVAPPMKVADFNFTEVTKF